MSAVLQQLIELLNLEAIETNVFCGNSQDLGFGSLFGGQVLGQALVAAGRTVEASRSCHSLQGYFLRAGKPSEPIYYEVDLIRSGKSFSTRRVVAKQRGLAIFSMSASFQVLEKGFEHQNPMPSVPGPDHLLSELELARRQRDKIPAAVRDKLTADRAIDIRPVEASDPFAPIKRPALKHTWLRADGQMPDDQVLHQAMLAYASDFGLASTSLMPHGVTFFQYSTQVASLDHSMWFHRPFRIDEWLLYVKDSPIATGARGFNRGQIFTQKGELVVSVAQEALIRTLKPKSSQQPDKTGGLVN